MESLKFLDITLIVRKVIEGIEQLNEVTIVPVVSEPIVPEEFDYKNPNYSRRGAVSFFDVAGAKRLTQSYPACLLGLG